MHSKHTTMLFYSMQKVILKVLLISLVLPYQLLQLFSVKMEQYMKFFNNRL